MKCVLDDKAKTAPFIRLKAGDTFQYAGNDYIKTDEELLATRLKDGLTGVFKLDTIITPTPNSVFYRDAKD